MDVPTYVEYGVADCGVAGRDVLLETGARRARAARPRLRALPCRGGEPQGPWLRARPVRHDARREQVRAARGARTSWSAAWAVEVVKLAGSVEIAPGLGLADCVVDVVETGRTLAENGLEEIETVAESSARLIVNRASFHARRAELERLLARLAEASR